MGKVLEMIRRLALFAALVLAGCSSDKTPDPYLSLIGGFGKSVKARIDRIPTPPLPEQILTRAQVKNVDTPILYAIVPATGAYATLSPLSENAGFVTWVTPDNATLTLKTGIVTATRGLGDDLTSSDISGLYAGLTDKKAGAYQRTYTFFTADFGTRTQIFDCTLSTDGTERVTILGKAHPVRKFTERCKSGTLAFQNHYWQATLSGNLIYSEQRVSPEVDVIRLWLLSE